MYQQIINLLKQNHIPCENIVYTDNFGSIVLNDDENWDEYIISEDKGVQYIWFRQADKERNFNILQQLNLNGVFILILKEV